MTKKQIEAAHKCMDIVRYVRANLPEAEMDKYINPLEDLIHKLLPL